MDDFKKIIEGKNVLLLGPASYLKDKVCDIRFGDYDLVVKINKMVEKSSFSSEEFEVRNDILYHCLDINIPNGDMPYSIKTWINKGVKHLRITHPPVTHYYARNISRFIDLNKELKIPSSIVSRNVFESICMESKTSPNAGTIAICDLLSNNPSTLSIKGITFCKTPYSEGYKEDVFYNNKKRTNQHDHDKQIIFFKSIFEKNNNVIKIDSELESILERY
jgi:hypothetical protein